MKPISAQRALLDGAIYHRTGFVRWNRCADAQVRDARLKPAPDPRPSLSMVLLDIDTNRFGELYYIGLHSCGQLQVYTLGEPRAAPTTRPEMQLE